MIRAWATCVAAILVLGCQDREEPVRGSHQGFEPPVEYQLPLAQSPQQPIEPTTPDPPAPRSRQGRDDRGGAGTRLGSGAQSRPRHSKRLRAGLRSQQPHDASHQRQWDCAADRNYHRAGRVWIRPVCSRPRLHPATRGPGRVGPIGRHGVEDSLYRRRDQIRAAGDRRVGSGRARAKAQERERAVAKATRHPTIGEADRRRHR